MINISAKLLQLKVYCSWGTHKLLGQKFSSVHLGNFNERIDQVLGAFWEAASHMICLPSIQIYSIVDWENKIIWQTDSIGTRMILAFIALCGFPSPWVWAGPVICFWLIEFGKGDRMCMTACMWPSFGGFEQAAMVWGSVWRDPCNKELRPWANSWRETEVLVQQPARNWLLQ